MFNSVSYKSAVVALMFGLTGHVSIGIAAEGKDPATSEKAEAEVKLTPVETLIFDTNHMNNVAGGQTLKYSFERKGALGDDFSDTVALKVTQGDSGKGKTVNMAFFTGERQKPYPEFSNAKANPLLIVFFNKDAWYLARRIKAKGVANYLRNRIIDGLHQVKSIEATTCSFDGKDVPAQLITFAPFSKDENRHHLVHYQALQYNVVLADDVPGGVCSISSVVPNQKEGVPEHYVNRLKKQGMQQLAAEAEKVNMVKGKGVPVVTETLTFVGVVKTEQASVIKQEG